MTERCSHHCPLRDDPRCRIRNACGRRALQLVIMLVTALAVSALVAFGPAIGDARAASDTARQKVAVFEDAVVAPGDVYDTVVVVGGDLLVEGTVRNVVVVVGGDVTVASTAELGAGPRRSQDTVLVSVFGDVTIEPGARVMGETVDVAGRVAGISASSVSDPFFRPWRAGAVLNWVWSTIFLAVVAVIASAIAPRQIVVVSDRVGHHFFSSLGLGALGAIIAVPIITAAMIVTIIGILVVIPWLFIGLPLLWLFGFVAVGAAFGRLFFRGAALTRGTVILASLVGVVIINLLRWIPVGGLIILGLLGLVGFGAAYVSIYMWLRDRRRRRKQQAQLRHGGPGSPGGPGVPAGPGATGGPSPYGGSGNVAPPASAGGNPQPTAPVGTTAPVVPPPGPSSRPPDAQTMAPGQIGTERSERTTPPTQTGPPMQTQ